MRDLEPRGIGLFGGAFNPPHATHCRIASTALAQLPIAEVRVLPAGDHPHKRSRDMAAGEHRLAMCRLAFAGLPGVVVDDRELRRPGPSFTVDTVAAVQAEFPGRRLWLLVGSDNLPQLPTWRDHHRLLASCTVATFPRAGFPTGPDVLRGLDLTAGEREHLLAHVLTMPPDAVSATGLRAGLRSGAAALPELAPAVLAYVRAHHLYGA